MSGPGLHQKSFNRFPKEFFMPRCGATFDENSPLLGGASDSGRVAPMALGWVMRCWRRPTPAASATAVAPAATPPREGIFGGVWRQYVDHRWGLPHELWRNRSESRFDPFLGGGPR